MTRNEMTKIRNETGNEVNDGKNPMLSTCERDIKYHIQL